MTTSTITKSTNPPPNCASGRDFITSGDLVARVDITYRQLDYWCRAGAITPAVGATGYGSRRLWDPSIVAKLQRWIRAEQLLGPRDSAGGYPTGVLDRVADLLDELDTARLYIDHLEHHRTLA